MKAIETNNLVKKYGAKVAVDQMTFSVNEGEFYALLGVNGAGKSTLIKMLAGLTPPGAGEAAIFGCDVVRQAQKARAMTAVSPQETAVAANLSVRENLMLMAGVYGNRDPKARAEEMIREFDLSDYAGTRANALSGGWQRRLSIAMALAADPKVLFLDEPTLGLDVIARRALWKKIETLKGRVTIVLTTHYLEEAEALSDRIGIMAEGRLRAEGTARELIALSGKETFEDAFIELSAAERGL